MEPLSKGQHQVGRLTSIFVLTLLVVTTLSSIAQLAYSIRGLKARGKSQQRVANYLQEIEWKHAELSMPFTNKGFHITSDQEWAALIPVNQGKFRIHGQDDGEYMLAMHQQLQCLNVVRIAYLEEHKVPSTMPPVSHADADSCIEQLRQFIMCQADLTLEPSILQLKPDGRILAATTGLEAVHRCRDWKLLELEVAKSSL